MSDQLMATGALRKMLTHHGEDDAVTYELPVGESRLPIKVESASKFWAALWVAISPTRNPGSSTRSQRLSKFVAFVPRDPSPLMEKLVCRRLVLLEFGRAGMRAFMTV